MGFAPLNPSYEFARWLLAGCGGAAAGQLGLFLGFAFGALLFDQPTATWVRSFWPRQTTCHLYPKEF